jgi:hypothetical protein
MRVDPKIRAKRVRRPKGVGQPFLVRDDSTNIQGGLCPSEMLGSFTVTHLFQICIGSGSGSPQMTLDARSGRPAFEAEPTDQARDASEWAVQAATRKTDRPGASKHSCTFPAGRPTKRNLLRVIATHTSYTYSPSIPREPAVGGLSRKEIGG